MANDKAITGDPENVPCLKQNKSEIDLSKLL